MSFEKYPVSPARMHELLKDYCLSRLTGRVFHKINNLMCIAMTNVEFMHTEVNNPQAQMKDLIKDTSESLSDMNKLTEAYNYISKSGSSEGRKVSLGGPLKKLSLLLDKDVIRNTSLELDEQTVRYMDVEDALKLVFYSIGCLYTIRERIGEKENLDIAIIIDKDSVDFRYTAAGITQKIKPNGSHTDDMALAGMLSVCISDLNIKESIEEQSGNIVLSHKFPG
jgi:hypothetical protein